MVYYLWHIDVFVAGVAEELGVVLVDGGGGQSFGTLGALDTRYIVINSKC